ncbi:hemolysin family protein [Aminiphilus circumscriptus]|uniref:hemolysin family protein n=1 Tax=Aminiphilus circumscriptus TaxID=290732 RepID=UPI000478607C|nr:hemolysin family protein [Aminiphilus circumscriptus]
MESDPASMELFLVVLLIALNGLFAMTEIAVITSRKARLEQRAAEGDTGARKALEIGEDPTHLLSAIQVGITLVGILTGYVGGASLSRALAPFLRDLPFLGAYARPVATVLVVALIAYATLVFGELVPKRIALNAPERLASLLARPMWLFSRITLPAVTFLSVSTKAVLRLFGAGDAPEHGVTEEEIRLVLAEGTASGAVEAEEKDLIERIIDLGERTVGRVMTPRTRVVWIDVEEPGPETFDLILQSGYSRFPVCAGNLDKVLGVVHVKDVLRSEMGRDNFDPSKVLRNTLFVPQHASFFDVLERFKASRIHEAVVIDEYGGVSGFVTVHDITEEIVGDLPSAHEADEPKIVSRGDGVWLVDGLLPVEELKRHFALGKLPDEEEGLYQTVGGFVVAFLGSIPAETDAFEWRGWRFEVVDMDGMRVDKVMLTLVPPAEEDEEEEETAGKM